MFCQKCGRELKNGASFCSGCGTPVHIFSDGSSAYRTYETKHQPKGFFASLASIIVSMLAGITGIAGTAALSNMGYIVYCLISDEQLVYPWISGTVISAQMYFPAIMASLVASTVLFAIASCLSRIREKIS